jgi:hypothetical protein
LFLIEDLSVTRSLFTMRRNWRFGLVAIIAAAVLGGFMPHGVLSAVQSAGAEMVQLSETPVSMPLNCMDVTCGKGTPASSAPAPAVALAAVLAGIAVAAVVASVIRRRRARVTALPAGSRDPLFRPPQFS